MGSRPFLCYLCEAIAAYIVEQRRRKKLLQEYSVPPPEYSVPPPEDDQLYESLRAYSYGTPEPVTSEDAQPSFP